jgi:hypothetical protein
VRIGRNRPRPCGTDTLAEAIADRDRAAVSLRLGDKIVHFRLTRRQMIALTNLGTLLPQPVTP